MRKSKKVVSHTPIPWTTEEYQGEPKRIVVGPNNEMIADCYADSSDDINLPENYKANADFIVRAVNSHEELLAALKLARAEIFEFNPDNSFVYYDSILAKAEAK